MSQESYNVFEIDKFLSPDICDELIKISEPKLEAARIGEWEIDEYRTALSCWLYDGDNVKMIRESISELLKTPVDNMEPLHITCYREGGQYKPHCDFFEYESEDFKKSGQRTMTAMIYLNDDFSGGETEFPVFDIKIKPSKGKLVIWYNLLSDGYPDHHSLHAGLPVLEGSKYIAVIWIRERTYIN